MEETHDLVTIYLSGSESELNSVKGIINVLDRKDKTYTNFLYRKKEWTTEEVSQNQKDDRKAR